MLHQALLRLGDRRVALFVFALLTSCGRPQPEPAPTAVRIIWEAPAPAEGKVEHTLLRPPGGAQAWKVEGATATRYEPYLPSGVVEPALWMTGSQSVYTTVPGPIPAKITGIEVQLVSRGRTNVQVTLVRNVPGEAEPQFENLQTRLKPGSPNKETLRFRRLPSGPNQTPFDEIRLRTDCHGSQVLLVSVALDDGPPEAGLPHASSGSELAYLNKEGRQSVVLTSDSYLRTQIEETDNRALALEVGVPKDLFPVGLNSKLHLSLHTENGKELSRDFGLVPGKWQPIWVPLEELGSEPALLKLTILASRPMVALIGNARIVPAAEQASAQPVVLLISSDTHRADHLGSSAEKSRQPIAGLSTQSLDALAASGVRFQDAWSSSNITLPSHTALLTGLHPRDSGVINNATAVRRDAHTLPERFAEAGYGTLGVVSSRHLSDNISGFGQGFDRYFETGRWDESAEDSVARLLNWIEAERGRPLFAFLHLFDAHAPYEPPEAFASEDTPGGLENRMRYLYAAEVSYLDSQLARLLEHPRLKDGIVAFTSDHGESLGAHGISFSHSELYPDTTHVPLLLRWPGAPQGITVPGEVLQQDLGRTLLDLAGLARLPFAGDSLLDWVSAYTEQSPTPNRPTFALSAGTQSAAIRHQGWMLVLHLAAHKPAGSPRSQHYSRHQVELFELDKDPGALEDLATRRPQRTKKLRSALIKWLREPRSGGVSKDAELADSDLQALEQLGYVGGTMGGAADPDALFPAECDCSACAGWQD